MTELWIIPIVICLLSTNNGVVFSFVPTTTTLSSSLSSAWGEAATTPKTTTEQPKTYNMGSIITDPSTATTFSHQHRREYSRYHMAPSSTQLQYSDDKNGMTNSNVELNSRVEDIFPGSEILTIEMADYQPLGCTVEESLHEEDDFIFISKLTAKGYAEKAGFQVGDVIVGVTGSFGQLTGVLDANVEKIKRLVSAVPDEDPLTIQVVRGTSVLERHESTVVDLCNLSGENEKEVEDCVVDFISGGYDYDIVDDVSASQSDEDAEFMLDNMMNLWAGELPLPPTTSGITDQTNNERLAKAPKPWSSRSSPSGTWVLDPKTRKMRNIDK